jgi:hypothetical protein
MGDIAVGSPLKPQKNGDKRLLITMFYGCCFDFIADFR